MFKRRLLVAAVASCLSGLPSVARSQTRANPFFNASTLPFEAPPFNEIRSTDYQPAIDAGIAQQDSEVARIASNPAPPTFENTLVALERSGALLHRVEHAFNAVTQANTNDTLQQTRKEEAPRLAALQDAIYLNPVLFKRVETIYNARGNLHLDPESRRLAEWYYKRFVHAGAKLSAADRTKLQQLNQEASTLSATFARKLLGATKAGALVVDDRTRLAGLSDAAIAAAAQDATHRGLIGKWLIPLQNTTQQPALTPLDDRSVREQLFNASWIRAEKNDANDTRSTIERLAQLRAEKAKLLGYPDYASWVLEENMAKNPATVFKFVRGLVPPATAKARAEGDAIQAMIRKDGQTFQLEPWDWNHYAEQVRKAQFDLDENQIKPYFELNDVLQNGVFYAANQLYGLTFKERKDIPVYQPDVRVFEVFDVNGSPLALFYCDYFKRDNKQGGAWNSNFVVQAKILGQKPVVYNVTNFTKPAPGQPALLSFDDVITMFHEFGHALHGLFAAQEYPTLSGTAVAGDWGEFPSQFNEHWASDPQVFAHYAVHYQTHQPMPADLVAKIRSSALFNSGYAITEILGASDLDMQWHEFAVGQAPKDVDQFEAEALKRTGLDFAPVPPRYRSSYFQHIWGSSYAAGYYDYTWTRMLADDSFAWFKSHGGLTRKNGDRFRDAILSRGNTRDYGQMFRAFNGHDPDVKPFLIDHGLDTGSK
jgi:peptidyl-dipeptidase Dcp